MLLEAEKSNAYSSIGEGRYFGSSQKFSSVINDKLSYINIYLNEACRLLGYDNNEMMNWGHFTIKHSEGGL